MRRPLIPLSIGPLLIVAAAALMACKSSSPNAPSAPSAAAPTTAGRFEVTLPGSGLTQGGVLFRPEVASDLRPALIVLHGWQTAGTNGALAVEARARRYSEEGYVALALSMRGWPPTDGADDCGLRQPDDVAAAVDWIRAQPGVDGARVGLVGFSQGGQVALLAGNTRRARSCDRRLFSGDGCRALERDHGQRRHPWLYRRHLRAWRHQPAIATVFMRRR